VDKLAKEVQRGTLPKKILPKPKPLQGPSNDVGKREHRREGLSFFSIDPFLPAVNGSSSKRYSKEYEQVTNGASNKQPGNTQDTYDIPVGKTNHVPNDKWPNHVLFIGATTENLPAGVLYQVKASYKYQAEDTDELNFDVF